MIDYLISVCIKRDIDIWKKSSINIIKNIIAKNYVVICPKEDMFLFQENSPEQFVIVSEEDVINGINIDYIRNFFPAPLKSRCGWYFQQLLKIEYIRKLEPNSIAVIWDADTIPLRKIDFLSENRLIFRLGNHKPKIHEPYFELINSLLHIERKFDESFISNCLPTRTEWVQSFCNKIEENGNAETWALEILEYIKNNPNACGFSEYESLGSYFFEYFSDQMVFQNGNYFRPANYICDLDKLNDIEIQRLKNRFDYLAYDGYVKDSCNGLNLGCGTIRIENSIEGSKVLNIDKFDTNATDFTYDVNNQLPFHDEKFIQIVAHNILEHVNEPFSVLMEINRVLRIGGFLHIEVPHSGSYNHGTDITHTRGMTFSSFNFLFSDYNYLYPKGGSPFKFELVEFNYEINENGTFGRKRSNYIPRGEEYTNWLTEVINFRIPGTFGFIARKLS